MIILFSPGAVSWYFVSHDLIDPKKILFTQQQLALVAKQLCRPTQKRQDEKRAGAGGVLSA